MSKENTYQALILKKQPLNEGDEIVTLFTKEYGKMRVLAKSSKFAKSKLQYSLQALFLVNIRTAGSGLPKITGTEVVQAYANLRENYEAIKTAYYAVELILKFTPDEQKNEALFGLGVDFFTFLDKKNLGGQELVCGRIKFQISFLDSVGFGIHYHADALYDQEIFFSNSQGSFLLGKPVSDSVLLAKESYEQFLQLHSAPFTELSVQAAGAGGKKLAQLEGLLSRFIAYQLEREVKSERYLHM